MSRKPVDTYVHEMAEELTVGENGQTNGDKKTLEMLLRQSIDSQSRMADAMIKNSEALTENTHSMSDMVSALKTQSRRYEILQEEQTKAIRNIPEITRKIVHEEILNVPSNSWKSIGETLGRIGSIGGGLGILIGVAYLLFKLITGTP